MAREHPLTTNGDMMINHLRLIQKELDIFMDEIMAQKVEGVVEIVADVIIMTKKATNQQVPQLC